MPGRARRDPPLFLPFRGQLARIGVDLALYPPPLPSPPLSLSQSLSQSLSIESAESNRVATRANELSV